MEQPVNEELLTFYVIDSPTAEPLIVIADNFTQASRYAREHYGPKVRRATAVDMYRNQEPIEDVRSDE